MRVEVPMKVFPVLQAYRQRNGSMALLDPLPLIAELRASNQAEEADWILANEKLVAMGAVVGFIAEGTVLPPEPPRGSPPEEVW